MAPGSLSFPCGPHIVLRKHVFIIVLANMESASLSNKAITLLWSTTKSIYHLSLALLISRLGSDTVPNSQRRGEFSEVLEAPPSSCSHCVGEKKKFWCQSLTEILLITFFLNFHTFNSFYGNEFLEAWNEFLEARYFLLKICFSLWNIILELLIYCSLLLH